jgi:hypothetical protein
MYLLEEPIFKYIDTKKQLLQKIAILKKTSSKIVLDIFFSFKNAPRHVNF